MNNIYKVIWSKAKNCYVVASEIARSHTKSASGSEKIGGGTRRKLLASLMALSLLCGGLGVAEASVHVNEVAGGTSEVYTTDETYTQTEADAKLDLKANAADVSNELAKKADAANVYTKTEADGKLDLKANAADVYTKTDVDGKLANKADKATTLAGYGINDAYTKGDVDGALNNKADKATTLTGYGITDAYTKTEVDAAVAGAVTTAGTNVDTKLADYAKTVDVDAKLAGKADKATTLAGYGITDAYTKGQVDTALGEKADKTALTQATGRITTNENAIDKLKEKTTDISWAAGDGTKISGVTIKDGNIIGNGNSAITGLTNVATGSINGKSLAGTTVATEKDVSDAVKVETDARTAADAVLEGKINDEKTAREAEDTNLSNRIGTVTDDGEYIKKSATNNVSENLKVLDTRAKTNADAIAQETTDRKAAIGQLAVNGNYIEKDKNVSDNLVKLDNQAKANADAIVETDKRTGGITRNLEKTQTTIEGAVKVDNQGNVKDVKNLSAETITTTGNASIGGDLKVAGTITTDKMIFGDKATNNYTEIDHGKVTSKNLVVNGAGETISSSSTFNAEENKVGFANSATGEQSFHKQTSDIIMDNVKDRENSNNRTQTKTETKDIITDKDGNSSTTSQTASENKTYLKDKDGKNTNSTVDTAKGYDKTIKGENGETSTKQDELNITNTAQKGTITNDAQNIVNNATGDMTNTVGGKLTTTVTGQATEEFNGGLNTTVTGAENHTVNGKQTNTVTEGQENIISGGQTNTITGGQINNITGDQTTTVTGDISNTAKNITNEANTKLTDKVGENTRVLDSEGITDTVGGSTFKQRIDKIMMESKDVSIKAEETLTNEAKVITNKASEVINNEAVNINNTATGIITSKASEIKNQADKLISNKVGENTWENMENGKITTSIKDGAKQNLTQSDAAGTTQSTVDVGKSTVTIQNADGLTDAVTDGRNTSVQNQTASQIAAAVKDGAGNENASVANATTSANTITNGTKANTVISTADGTSFSNSEAAAPVTGASGAGTHLNTTIKGNTITTGKVTMDYAEVMKDLGVRGNANITGKTTTGSLEVKGESKLTGDVTMGSNATVKKDFTVEGNTNLKNTKVDGTLDVTQKANFGDSVSIAKDLSVGGNATIKGDVTASSYKVGDKTYISAAGINANDQKITNVADGSISEGSKDAVNGGQLYTVKNDLEGKVNKVGANAAAMANLHPMEFDPDSKWNIAAAIGNYGSETAAALGAFYRPNDDVMVNLSTAFGTGENMVGGGVSVRLGKSGNKLSREENNALKDQVNDLTARMDALLSVLNPNMSKNFPDVPENHWAYEAVSRLAGNDIVQGYPDGEFHGDRTMTRYEMAEIIYNALSRGAEAEKELVEEFKPELQAMAASEKATAERAQG